MNGGKTRDEMIEYNMGLVHACARKFIGRGAEYDDLVQAGCVGLIKAVDNFDESRGFLFSTIKSKSYILLYLSIMRVKAKLFIIFFLLFLFN